MAGATFFLEPDALLFWFQFALQFVFSALDLAQERSIVWDSSPLGFPAYPRRWR
jgi:hypothetical protein